MNVTTTESSSDESIPSYQSKDGSIEHEENKVTADEKISLREQREFRSKSPTKSPRRSPIKSRAKGYKSPIKGLKNLDSSVETNRPSIVTSKKDKNGGRAYDSDIRTGALSGASNSQYSPSKHIQGVEKSWTAQSWRVREYAYHYF